MTKRFSILFILLCLATLPLFPQCTINQIKTIPPSSAAIDKLEIINVNGVNYAFVKESVLVEFINVTNASNPVKNGTTANLTGVCGANLEVVGTYGAAANATAVFVSVRCGDILCYSLANMPAAKECARIEGTTSEMMDVYRSGSNRYLIVGGNGIKYADYTDLGGAADTRTLVNWITGIFPRTIRVDGDYLTVSTSNSANIYNISGMPSHSLMTSCSGLNPFDSYYDISSGYLFVADGDGYFKIINPNSCAVVGQIDIQCTAVSFIDKKDDLIFIALGTYLTTTDEGGFRILDVSNPAVPVDVTGNGSDFYTGQAAIAAHPSSNHFYTSEGSPTAYSYVNCSAIQGPNINISGTPQTANDRPSGGPSCLTNPNQGPFACDGNIDSGEEFELRIDLKNSGTATADNVMGTLRYDEVDSLVTVTQNVAGYGNIIPAGTVSPSSNYRLTVDPAANTTSSPITKHFILTAEDNGGTQWDIGFDLQIQGSRAVLVRTLNHNEAGQIVGVSYENQGTLASDSFTLKLETSTTGLSYTSTLPLTVPSMASGGGLEGPFNYSYTTSAPCSPLNFISTHYITSPIGADQNEEYEGVAFGTYTGAAPYVAEQSSTAFTRVKTVGTTYEVFFTLANLSPDSATNVTATLTTDRTDIITISDNTAVFGTIFAGGTKTNPGTDPFILNLVDPSSGSAVFTLSVTSDQGCWEAVFVETDIATWLQDFNLTYLSWRAYGCGTSPLPSADPHPDLYEGQCWTFKFELRNDGDSSGMLDATLTSPSAEAVVINTDTYNIGASPAVAENLSGFMVDISLDFCPTGSSQALTLTLQVPDAGFTKVIPLTILPSTTPIDDPILQYKSTSITADNDSNGQANPGETVSFNITVANIGDGAANNVTAKISDPTSNADKVTINASLISLGAISAGQTVTSSSSFRVTFSSDISGNLTFSFPVTLTATEGQWAGNLQITVIDPSSAPDIAYAGYSFCDDTYGNADGVWNPGEKIPLAVKLVNNGSMASVNLAVTLETTLANMAPQTQTVTISRIMPGGASADAVFLITMGNTVTAQSIPFTVTAAAVGFDSSFNVDVTQDNNGTCGGGSSGAPAANFTWTPSTPSAGETVFFTDYSSGGPTSWSWNFGDGATSGVQHPNHVYSAAGIFRVSLSVSNDSGSNSMEKWITIEGGGGPPTGEKTFVLPVATRFHGNYDSYWVTDLFLHNPNSSGEIDINFRFSYIYQSEGNTVDSTYTLTLNPMQTIIIEDILTIQFPTAGLPDDISGTLLVDFGGSAPIPPIVAGRIYNKRLDGTFGQYIPAISMSNPIRDYTDDVTLYALEQDADFRTQVGTTNLSSEPNTITYTVFNSEGLQVEKFQRIIGGISNDQFSLYAYVTDAGPYTVKAHSESALSFTSYASVSDKITSDAIFQPDTRDTDEMLYLPGVTHALGSQNSNWRTDLYLYNPSGGQIVLTALLYPNSLETPSGFLTTKNYTLNTGETMVIKDIVQDMMPDNTEDITAYLIFKVLLGPENGFPYISSRTYNLADEGGTFGQYIPALSQNISFGEGQLLFLSGVRQDDEWRTNVGFVNHSPDVPLVVALTLYDPEGNPVRVSAGFEVQPLSGRQLKLSELFGDIQIIAGTIKIEVISGNGGYIYASIVDNRVNDGIFIAAMKEPQKVQ